MDVQEIQMRKALGTWTPDRYLSNLAIMHFESPTYAHKRLFPICPVQFPSGHYYEFSKADLARDNVKLKPPYGSVQPGIFGINTNSYSCQVWQAIVGLDKIMNLPYEREGAIDPIRYRTRHLAEQIALHQEIEFAEKFFKASAWTNVWTGANTANAAQKKFKKFDAADSDPVGLIEDRMIEIRRNGRRKPNKLALGVETFKALKNHKSILERIMYTGNATNPAVVNEQVLAQVFGVEEVVVLDCTFNAAGIGQEDMQFVSDSKAALLMYTPQTPQPEEASAGYIFTWQLQGGDYINVEQHEGPAASHTDLLEAVIAYDMRRTSDDLAVFLSDCVG